jgi:hypothetical protein
MDSIERMRRINDLTRELKQHGFAESSFEAIKQANQIYGDDDVEEHVKQGMIPKSNHERMLKGEEEDHELVSYTDKKLGKVLENVDALTNKMNEIIRAINDLDSRMNDVKIKCDKLAVARQESKPEPKAEFRSVTDVEIKHEDKKPEEKVNESKVEHVVPKDEYAMNQHTGNFQSQDVSIDKVFYFGKK